MGYCVKDPFIQWAMIERTIHLWPWRERRLQRESDPTKEEKNIPIPERKDQLGHRKEKSMFSAPPH
jgi:hypothetical protein